MNSENSSTPTTMARARLGKSKAINRRFLVNLLLGRSCWAGQSVPVPGRKLGRCSVYRRPHLSSISRHASVSYSGMEPLATWRAEAQIICSREVEFCLGFSASFFAEKVKAGINNKFLLVFKTLKKSF
jgi:hypothetical protein